MEVTTIQLNIKTKRDDSGELARFFEEMKPLRVFLFSLVFLCIGSKVFADSLVINYSNNKRLYK
jgi:hypothetical protein